MAERWWLGIVGVAVGTGLLVGLVGGRLDSVPALVAFQAIVVVMAIVLGLRMAMRFAAWRVPDAPTGAAPLREPALHNLDAWENLLVAAGHHAGDAHYRLRPRLRLLAIDALSRHHIDLDADPERARAALGEEAFDWLRRDRPAPPNRLGGGPGLEFWDRVVRAIEDLEADT